MTKRSLVLLEPQCQGFEHAPFNSALLKALELSDIFTRIYFMSEYSHFRLVEATHYRKNPIYQILSGNKLLRFIQEALLTLYISARNFISKDAVMFSSVTKTNLLTLGFANLFFSKKNKINVIIHSILSEVEIQNRFFSVRSMISFYLSTGGTLFVLGDSIEKNCKPKFNGSQRIRSIPHYYNVAGANETLKSHDFQYFACMGVLTKSAENLKKLTRFSPSIDKKFVKIVGFTSNVDLVKDLPFDVPTSPIERSKYEYLISNSTFTLSVIDSKRYRYTASGTFLDSVFIGKPGIYLRNDFVAYYFDRYGDLGYLCNNMRDVHSIMYQLSSGELCDTSFYQHCLENIIKARKHFEPSFENTVVFREVYQ